MVRRTSYLRTCTLTYLRKRFLPTTGRNRFSYPDAVSPRRTGMTPICAACDQRRRRQHQTAQQYATHGRSTGEGQLLRVHPVDERGPVEGPVPRCAGTHRKHALLLILGHHESYVPHARIVGDAGILVTGLLTHLIHVGAGFREGERSERHLAVCAVYQRRPAAHRNLIP